MSAAPPVTMGQIAGLLARRHEPGDVLVAGITGSVAAGKSTLAAGVKQALEGRYRVEILSTDGFLKTNAELEALDLGLRKGFPETYEVAALAETLEMARRRPVKVPGYSHSLYDVDPALARTIDRPDILLVEGLGFAPLGGDARVAQALDTLLYIDATEEDLEHWFLERFMALWHAAANDPASFYARFRHLGEAGARGFARTTVWRGINLPNLNQHIVEARRLADILLWKARDHGMRLVRPAS